MGTGRFVVRVAQQLVEADRWSLLVDAGERLVVTASTARGDVDRSYPNWRGIPGQAYSTDTACVVDDCQDTRSAAPASPTTSTERYRSRCCVPVDGRGLLLGEAYQPDAFGEGDLELLERLVEGVEAITDAATRQALPVVDGGRRRPQDDAELLEEIADILSHDLNNRLTGVFGYVALAEATGDEEYLELAETALERVENLVDEVVHLARTGEFIEHREPVELERVARAAWDNLRADGATLEIASSVTLDASERGLRHLLENLFDNALEHAGPSVTVRVGATESGFFVEDDGPGIPAGSRNRLFERGFSRYRGSTGLGLHIVERIADAHGWEIRVDESSTGGARFECITERT